MSDYDGTELQALRDLVAIIETLTEDQAQRVLDYLADRYRKAS
jgi:hypothetical protein